jgi:hypothetical protein
MVDGCANRDKKVVATLKEKELMTRMGQNFKTSNIWTQREFQKVRGGLQPSLLPSTVQAFATRLGVVAREGCWLLEREEHSARLCNADSAWLPGGAGC